MLSTRRCYGPTVAVRPASGTVHSGRYGSAPPIDSGTRRTSRASQTRPIPPRPPPLGIRSGDRADWFAPVLS